MMPPLESLRPCWFAACLAEELRGRPLARKVLGVPLVLFRAGEKVAALEDRCPHRNAALSDGRVADGLIECPYHGWSFDGAGACRRIPGMVRTAEHRCQAARAVTVVEHEGMIWVRLGATDEHAPGLPTTRHRSLQDPDFDTFLWAAQASCSLVDGLENLLDACHPHFAHAGLVRTAAQRRIVDVQVRRDAAGVEAVYQENHVAKGFIPRLLEGQRQSSIGRFFPPATAQLEYRGDGGPRFLLTSCFTPCDDRSVLIHSYLSTPRRWAPAWLKRRVLRAIFGRVLRQDQDVLRRQQANIDRFGGPEFTSTPLDVIRPHLLYFLRHPDPATRSDFETRLQMEL